ncbi:hypothetical protein NIZ92_07420 [Alcaligenes sp. 1735tsa3]|uniref:hypothetical protein n=1 Tax=Alcaligenes sp. 1735tsa3 TaxID=2953809 RepID=UPI0020A81DC4|nr:hypothetical protein [Alcaligenes sp. 1735tsa3]USY26860.1 hypothetical protein NIZ92_07420 [Alcaligenes sp. 1735tsa3]
MSAGIRVRNQNGTIQIGPDYANYALEGGRTNFSVLERPVGFANNSSPPAGVTSSSLIVSSNLDDQPYFGWNWGYCWIFKPADQVAVSGLAGKRVRNPNTGRLVFDSSHRYLRIVDHVRSYTNLTKTYPAGRQYRVAPLSWQGLDIIRHVGDAGMGDGSQLYTQEWRSMRYQILGNVLQVTQAVDQDAVMFDGPPNMNGTLGSDPMLELLVVDMTGYPGV